MEASEGHGSKNIPKLKLGWGFECAYYAIKMSLVYEKNQIDLHREIEIAIIVYESGCKAHFRFLGQ